MRKLKLTVSGRWYIALTIGLGVTAMLVENNVLYLIESLLLSGLILSGILSERTVYAIEVDIQRRPVAAKSPTQDIIFVSNKKNFPVFCVEIGEWSNGKVTPIAYLPRIGPHTKIQIQSRQIFQNRGIHRWDGLTVSTSYPLGLAKKIKISKMSDERWIWPEILNSDRKKEALGSDGKLKFGISYSEGEIRPKNHDDDSRMIVWPLSVKGTDPVVRMRRSEEHSPHLTLDLRTQSEPHFENLIKTIAQPYHQQNMNTEEGILIVVNVDEKKIIHGKKNVLNFLATVQPSQARGRAS